MKKKNELKLQRLSVQSFVTSENLSKENMKEIKGGDTEWTILSIEYSVDACLPTNPLGPTKECQVA